MQWLLLTILLTLTTLACRRIAALRRSGMPQEALRRYRRAAWALGGMLLAAMAVQETILLFAGLLTWRTGLPMHLCSLMGLMALPTLLSRRPLLLDAALFAGLPGALLALIFPAALQTPWPRATLLAFHTLHAGLVCVPLLPMALGWTPRPAGAARAWGFLLIAALGAGAVNAVTGGNYLFLSGPVPGTPLQALARWGTAAYRLLLALLAALVLAAEALALAGVRRFVFPAADQQDFLKKMR